MLLSYIYRICPKNFATLSRVDRFCCGFALDKSMYIFRASSCLLEWIYEYPSTFKQLWITWVTPYRNKIINRIAIQTAWQIEYMWYAHMISHVVITNVSEMILNTFTSSQLYTQAYEYPAQLDNRDCQFISLLTLGSGRGFYTVLHMVIGYAQCTPMSSSDVHKTSDETLQLSGVTWRTTVMHDDPCV